MWTVAPYACIVDEYLIESCQLQEIVERSVGKNY